jgi:acyl-CoA thioester hydrolase
MTRDARPVAKTRSEFPYQQTLATRWRDNDQYGHLNNVVYYELLDSVVNGFLAQRCAFDFAASAVLGLVVESRCSYLSPVGFPAPVVVGLGIARLGSASVSYSCAVFAASGDLACAQGLFTHVYVDRSTRRPSKLPTLLREEAERLMHQRSPLPC